VERKNNNIAERTYTGSQFKLEDKMVVETDFSPQLGYSK
jgi:hypothetical protein